MKPITITPGKVSLRDWGALYGGASFLLNDACWQAVERGAEILASAAASPLAIYGVNTGFGKLANVRIEPDNLRKLQRNLILSHCCGVGDVAPLRITRLMMILKINSLARGASGVRPLVIKKLCELISKDLIPVVPAQGSVGASGDLAPLAHMTAVLLGEGEAFYQGSRLSAREALERAEIEPLELEAKEGLALINGTQFSTAFALASWLELQNNFKNAVAISALSTDGIMGSTAPLLPEIHALRGMKGQIKIAASELALLEGSIIRESHRFGDDRVQDPYCIRCQPQVAGAALDVMLHAGITLALEANAVTDNPLVLSDGSIISGGNFHAEPVGFAADMMALSIAELGSISQRRIALMVDPTLNCDLPAFLSTNPGLNSGLMIAEVTSAALMAENKFLATPCVTDSTPTSANQEDHVSMAAHGARRLQSMLRNLERILAIEWICAAQAVELRAPLKTSQKLQAQMAKLRQKVPFISEDRVLAPDIESAAEILRNQPLEADGLFDEEEGQ